MGSKKQQERPKQTNAHRVERKDKTMAVIYEEINGQSIQQRKEILLDSSADLASINTAETDAGSFAYCVADGSVYILDSSKNWVQQ